MPSYCFIPLSPLEQLLRGVSPARTTGPLGINDQGDPNVWSFSGDTPCSLGINDHASPLPDLAFKQNLLAGKVLTRASAAPEVKETEEILLLAAVAYGEASAENVAEEIGAIASVIVRQQKARGITVASLLGPRSTFAFAASDGNPRVAAFRKASAAARKADAGMSAAIAAAHNAVDGGTDYSNGAYFWDGYDFKTNKRHPKKLKGVKFTDPAHNIFDLTDTTVDKTTYWERKGKDGKTIQGAKRGHYTYVYESTAAHGGTIFWKYGADFIKATANTAYD